MPELPMSQCGLFAIHDTGAPAGENDYPTLILIHGYAWHSGVFNRMVPFAAKHGTRLVLVNRRDYPGATPYTEDEHELLKAGIPSTPEAAVALRTYIEARGKDLYDFLGEFIAKESPPEAGGIILAAWSFATVFLTSLLANAATFPPGDINVASYLRFVVNYDTPYVALGYPPLDGGYNPLLDDVSREEGAKRFPIWVSGYYNHGETPSTLETRTPLSERPSTIQNMSAEDIHSSLYPAPGNPGGSDSILFDAGIQHRSFKDSRRKAYFLPETSANDWDKVMLRHVWCDQSVWETTWTKMCLEEEFEEAKKVGKKIRPHEFLRMHKANHFIHWDEPERALLVLLGDNRAAETGMNRLRNGNVHGV